MRIADLFSNEDTLLTLEPEELAGIVLQHLASLTEHSNDLNRYNFTLPSNMARLAPNLSEGVARALTEAWIWLERECPDRVRRLAAAKGVAAFVAIPLSEVGWFVRPFVSGPGFLCGLRLSVRPSPCERLSHSRSITSGSDSLQTSGSPPFESESPTCLPLPWPSLACLGSGLPLSPGSPFRGATSVCLAAVFRLTSATSGV
jgi:hypothetical protein